MGSCCGILSFCVLFCKSLSVLLAFIFCPLFIVLSILLRITALDCPRLVSWNIFWYQQYYTLHFCRFHCNQRNYVFCVSSLKEKVNLSLHLVFVETCAKASTILREWQGQWQSLAERVVSTYHIFSFSFLVFFHFLLFMLFLLLISCCIQQISNLNEFLLYMCPLVNYQYHSISIHPYKVVSVTIIWMINPTVDKQRKKHNLKHRQSEKLTL